MHRFVFELLGIFVFLFIGFVNIFVSVQRYKFEYNSKTFILQCLLGFAFILIAALIFIELVSTWGIVYV